MPCEVLDCKALARATQDLEKRFALDTQRALWSKAVDTEHQVRVHMVEYKSKALEERLRVRLARRTLRGCGAQDRQVVAWVGAKRNKLRFVLYIVQILSGFDGSQERVERLVTLPAKLIH